MGKWARAITLAPGALEGLYAGFLRGVGAGAPITAIRSEALSEAFATASIEAIAKPRHAPTLAEQRHAASKSNMRISHSRLGPRPQCGPVAVLFPLVLWGGYFVFQDDPEDLLKRDVTALLSLRCNLNRRSSLQHLLVCVLLSVPATIAAAC